MKCRVRRTLYIRVALKLGKSQALGSWEVSFLWSSAVSILRVAKLITFTYFNSSLNSLLISLASPFVTLLITFLIKKWRRLELALKIYILLICWAVLLQIQTFSGHGIFSLGWVFVLITTQLSCIFEQKIYEYLIWNILVPFSFLYWVHSSCDRQTTDQRFSEESDLLISLGWFPVALVVQFINSKQKQQSKQLCLKLQRKIKRLKQKQTERDTYYFSQSHEMRNPLNAVAGSI